MQPKILGFVVALALSLVVSMATAQEGAARDQRSDKDAGLVFVNSNLVPSDGRMVIKIVAYNKSTKPATLRPEQIRITTVTGKEVPLESLAQLEDDARVAFGLEPESLPGDWSSTLAMKRPTVVNAGGKRNVGGLSGGDTIITSEPAARPRKVTEASVAELQAELDKLRAAILQPVSIEPQTAGGGNVVTQPIEFSRKESRGLTLAVEFAGESHEFKFDLPRH